ncbi:MAG: hypothetical protein HY720_19195 [Planctomycetes bacterium]|nr:hypothetical protein [Planctomycetota bacterium]
MSGMLSDLGPAQAAGIAFFFLTILASRVYTRRLVSRLDSQLEFDLAGAVQRQKVWAWFPVAIVTVLFFLCYERYREHGRYVGLGYLAALVFLGAGSVAHGWRRLRSLGLPPAYLREFAISRAIQYAGLVVLFACLFLPSFRR